MSLPLFRNINWAGLNTVYGMGADSTYLYGAAAGNGGTICRYRFSDGSYRLDICIKDARRDG